MIGSLSLDLIGCEHYQASINLKTDLIVNCSFISATKLSRSGIKEFLENLNESHDITF